MADALLPGDLNPGDLIVVPGQEGRLLVRAIRLGRGGFLLTVSAPESPSPATEWIITLTAATWVSRHGRATAS